MSLEEVECFLIKKAMTRFDGNVSQAAKALGPEPERPVPPAAALRALDSGCSRTTGQRHGKGQFRR